MNQIIILLAAIMAFVLTSCNKMEEPPKADSAYLAEINNWHTKRIKNLKKENGWLNLVGLHWLNEGENTFGSNKRNDIIFPVNKAAEFLGKIIKNGSTIITIVNEDAAITYKSKPINKIEMKVDITGDPTILEHKTLRWFIIKRGDKYGVRLRDLEAELLKNFEGIERFQIDSSWKVIAKFEKYETPKKIMIPTILGTIEKELSPGKLLFNINGKEYSLLPTSAGEKLFIVFADLTSGEETYGAGRFLYVDGPDSNNNVILDFNKAYNPPCAFTKYATCPLPPDENKLRVRITAGEKKYGKGH